MTKDSFHEKIALILSFIILNNYLLLSLNFPQFLIKINLSIKELKRYKVKFSVQKNIKFSNTNKIANRLARAFKNFKILKF